MLECEIVQLDHLDGTDIADALAEILAVDGHPDTNGGMNYIRPVNRQRISRIHDPPPIASSEFRSDEILTSAARSSEQAPRCEQHACVCQNEGRSFLTRDLDHRHKNEWVDGMESLYIMVKDIMV
jgi:hypothetical protein